MRRSIDVEVDQNTWPAKGAGLPPFPAAFSHGVTPYDLDVLSALLVIGQLTTPPIASGATLSEFWAWVRYATAIASTSDLRITKPFADLDSHQKTILSDDFGMGVPVTWLIGALDLVAWCDGRYFRERMSALLAIAPPPAKKSGPEKSPDFVFEDRAGFLHVVECKGTQGTPKGRETQFNNTDKNGKPTGGCVQKKSFAIAPPLAGQRLVCGLVLDHEHGKGSSSIKVVDPEFDETPLPEKIEIELWRDPLVRATLAKALRAAGLLNSASVVAAPSGETAIARRLTQPITVRREAARAGTVERRRAVARAELTAALDRPRIQVGDTELVGRSLTFTFPVPLIIEGEAFQAVSVRQGVRPDFLERLADEGFVDAPVMEGAPWLRESALGLGLHDQGNRGLLKVGQEFVAELTLDP